jgi:CBS domain-containing protein
VNAILPLLVAVTIAHAFTVLALRRSILTEKVSRRGYHLSREYATDPLEILFVREVMRLNVAALPASPSKAGVRALVDGDGTVAPQRLYPVVEGDGTLVGVVRRRGLRDVLRAAGDGETVRLDGVVERAPVVARPGEPLRVVAYRMAETGLTRLPVVDGSPGRLVGMIALRDLLEARLRNLDAERRRERFLPLRIVVPRRARRGVRAPETP